MHSSLCKYNFIKYFDLMHSSSPLSSTDRTTLFLFVTVMTSHPHFIFIFLFFRYFIVNWGKMIRFGIRFLSYGIGRKFFRLNFFSRIEFNIENECQKSFMSKVIKHPIPNSYTIPQFQF